MLGVTTPMLKVQNRLVPTLELRLVNTTTVPFKMIIRLTGEPMVKVEPQINHRPFLDVSAGTNHTCALRTSGSVACWGDNLGQSTPPTNYFLDLSVGENFSCGINEDNAVQCWGDDSYNQLNTP